MRQCSQWVVAMVMSSCMAAPLLAQAQLAPPAKAAEAAPAKQAEAPKFTREGMAQWKKEVLSQFQHVHYFNRANKEIDEEAFIVLMLEQNQAITMKRVEAPDGMAINVKVLTPEEIVSERAKAEQAHAHASTSAPASTPAPAQGGAAH
ncbi:MAG: hypothetical protein V4582_17305 [Pseudomonadota bacterium]